MDYQILKAGNAIAVLKRRKVRRSSFAWEFFGRFVYALERLLTYARHCSLLGLRVRLLWGHVFSILHSLETLVGAHYLLETRLALPRGKAGCLFFTWAFSGSSVYALERLTEGRHCTMMGPHINLPFSWDAGSSPLITGNAINLYGWLFFTWELFGRSMYTLERLLTLMAGIAP